MRIKHYRNTLTLIVALAMLLSLIPATAIGADTDAVKSVRVVYTGMVGWNTPGPHGAAWYNWANWRFNFAEGDVTHTFMFPEARHVEISPGVFCTEGINFNFRLQARLVEAYVFDLTVQDGIIIDVQKPEPAFMGWVNAVDTAANTLTLNLVAGGGTHVINTNTARLFQINEPVAGVHFRSGGTIVRAMNWADLQPGLGIRVYDDGAGNVLVYQTFVIEPYVPPVIGVPGLRTVRNMLENSLAPKGVSQYMWGGGYHVAAGAVIPNIIYPHRNNFTYGHFRGAPGNPAAPTRDVLLARYGYLMTPWYILASDQSKSVELNQSMIDFFFSHDIGTYNHQAAGGWRGISITASPPIPTYYQGNVGPEIVNNHSPQGMDCVGYASWVLFRTFNDRSFNDPSLAVYGSDYWKHLEFFQVHANFFTSMLYHRDFGTFHRGLAIENVPSPNFEESLINAGDVVSISGHVFIVLGVAEDGSSVIMHSSPSGGTANTPPERRPGGIYWDNGAGAQLTSVAASAGPASGAAGRFTNRSFELAGHYSRTFFPEWYRRYPVRGELHTYYNSAAAQPANGVLRWHDDERGLTDPDGFREMLIDDILAIMFGYDADGNPFNDSYMRRIVLEANDDSRGSVSRTRRYRLGHEATAIATVNAGYDFIGWFDGERIVSTSPEFTFTVTENKHLIAVFSGFGLQIFNNGPGGTASIPNAGLAEAGIIRMWTQLDGVNALVPYAELEVTAELPDGTDAMQFVRVNNMWNDPGNVNLIDVNKHAPWQTIILTATLSGQSVEVTLVNSRYLGLVAFNNGTDAEVPGMAGNIRIWPQLGGTSAPIPMDAVITAVDQDGNNAMQFVTSNRQWTDAGWRDYNVNFDVTKDAPWETITFTVTVYGQTVTLLLINDWFSVTPAPVLSFSIFNNGPGGSPSTPNASLAQAGIIRMWTQLDGVGSTVPFADLTVTATLPNGACAMEFVRVNNMWDNPGYVNLIDVNRNGAWESINFTAVLFGHTVELLLVNQ